MVALVEIFAAKKPFFVGEKTGSGVDGIMGVAATGIRARWLGLG